ncbi:unnamed protein product [Paramecium sonneborni]|uniref:Uncharacterized protein n=1 Tax=Paramecium sonneborni TaxID=65129 RepID=A0A8S1PHA6_9CILI|nr:unnamed protein product [Paramecium sonneborni]
MILKGEIIKSKQKVQFKISQLPKESQLNLKNIKIFLSEVDINEEYYDKSQVLSEAALQYFSAIGFNQNFDLSNAKQWIKSQNLIELTYVLKWIYNISSDDDKEQIEIVFDSKDDIVKRIILLNVALEQKKATSLPLDLVNNNEKCETLYGLSLNIQKQMENQDVNLLVPLLLKMVKCSNQSAIKQLILIDLFDKVFSKFPNQQNELFKQIQSNNIFQQQNWEEEFQDFIQQELEMPYFYFRKTKKVYQFTNQDYNIILNNFKKWEKILTEQLQEKVSPDDFFQNITQDENKEDEIQVGIKRQGTNRKKIKVVQKDPNEACVRGGLSKSVVVQQPVKQNLFQSNVESKTNSSNGNLDSQNNQLPPSQVTPTPPPPPKNGIPNPPPPPPPPTKGIPNPPPPPPPPTKGIPNPPPPPPPPTKGIPNPPPPPANGGPFAPLPIQIVAPTYSKFKFPAIEKDIDSTIWAAKLQDFEVQVNQGILKYFFQKERQKESKVVQKKKVQNEAVQISPSIFKDEMGIQLLQKTLQKFNLKEVMEQINELEFLSKIQDNQVRSIVDNLNLFMITQEQALNVEFNIKKAKRESEQKQQEENTLEKNEIEKLQSLQGEEKYQALLEFDQNLNILYTDIEDQCKEEETQLIITQLEKQLEQSRIDSQNLYQKQPQNKLELQEKEEEILKKYENALLEKHQFLKSKKKIQDKYQVHPNDLFLKDLYDRNPRNGVKIEAFYKEHLERKIHIENTVTDYREIFGELKKDEELILYFQYIKQYGKIFNNIKNDKFGYKFENILAFSYKTQQLEGNQEELIRYIVASMMEQNTILEKVNSMINQNVPYEQLENMVNQWKESKSTMNQKESSESQNCNTRMLEKLKKLINQKMPYHQLVIMINQMMLFKKLEETPYKNLHVLSQQNRALSEIQNIIKIYNDHYDWLSKHLNNLSMNEANKKFVEKGRKYANVYKEYIFQMQIIYDEDSKNFKEIRDFMCDSREKIESPKFFSDILEIKNQLRNYYFDIKKKKTQELKLSRRK